VERCLGCEAVVNLRLPMRVDIRGRASPSVAATVHETKWCAQGNRCFEATGMRRLNAQSPSELRWRLRVKSSHIYGFGNMMDLKHTISLMDSRRYRGMRMRRRAKAASMFFDQILLQVHRRSCCVCAQID
jgi:hypothetical protein